MKSKEELSALRDDLKALKERLAALSEAELTQVTGGGEPREAVSDGTCGFGVHPVNGKCLFIPGSLQGCDDTCKYFPKNN